MEVAYKQGRRLRGQRGTVPSKVLGGGDGVAYIPQNLQKYLMKYKCVVFPTVHILAPVMCISL